MNLPNETTFGQQLSPSKLHHQHSNPEASSTALKFSPNSHHQISDNASLQKTQENSTEDTTSAFKQQPASSRSESQPFFPQFTCQICHEHHKVFEFHMVFNCNHQYCATCIKSYIEQKISSFQLPTCPNEFCTENSFNQRSTFFQEFELKFVKLYKKVKKFNLVSNSDNFKLCPNQTCQGLVKLYTEQENTKKRGNCSKCSQAFCWTCMMKNHEKECQENTVSYLQENLRYQQCSKCKAVIQRNEGCSHMTCRCGFQFCYFCGEEWLSDHNEKCSSKPAVLDEAEEWANVHAVRQENIQVEMGRQLDDFLEQENQIVRMERNLTAENFLPLQMNKWISETLLKHAQRIERINPIIRKFLIFPLLIVFYILMIVTLSVVDVFLMALGFVFQCGSQSNKVFLAILVMILPLVIVGGLIVGLTKKQSYIFYKETFNQCSKCHTNEDQS